MAEPGRNERVPAPQRIRDLTAAYRRILDRYREIEILSREERAKLGNGGTLREVIEVLGTKKRILNEIRVEEERMKGAREWWKKTRRSLSAASCRELLFLLDAISGHVEEILAIESECRTELDRLMSWGPKTPPSAPAVGAAASLAYARNAQSAGDRP